MDQCDYDTGSGEEDMRQEQDQCAADAVVLCVVTAPLYGRFAMSKPGTIVQRDGPFWAQAHSRCPWSY